MVAGTAGLPGPLLQRAAHVAGEQERAALRARASKSVPDGGAHDAGGVRGSELAAAVMAAWNTSSVKPIVRDRLLVLQRKVRQALEGTTA
jgi:hypothetical protein